MSGDRIMEAKHLAIQPFGARQRDYFRLAQRDHDLTIKRLAALSSIPVSTLATWATGNTVMPAWAMVELFAHIPDDLNSMLVERAGKYVGTCEPGDGTLDALAREAAGFTSELLDARAPDSPGGPVVTPIETARLKERARKVACVARAVAA